MLLHFLGNAQRVTVYTRHANLREGKIILDTHDSPQAISRPVLRRDKMGLREWMGSLVRQIGRD